MNEVDDIELRGKDKNNDLQGNVIIHVEETQCEEEPSQYEVIVVHHRRSAVGS